MVSVDRDDHFFFGMADDLNALEGVEVYDGSVVLDLFFPRMKNRAPRVKMQRPYLRTSRRASLLRPPGEHSFLGMRGEEIFTVMAFWSGAADGDKFLVHHGLAPYAVEGWGARQEDVAKAVPGNF